MKLMKFKYLVLVASVCIMSLGSCADLDPIDYSEINPSNFPKTEEDIES